MDLEKVSLELVRAFRGKRSQAQINNRLGFKTNQVSRWESGKGKILWTDFLRLARACKISLELVLHDELGYFEDSANSSKLFAYLVGDLSQMEVAEKTGLSRFQISNLQKGKTKLTLEVVLKLIHHLHFLLSDFLLKLIEPGQIPSLAEELQIAKEQGELHLRFPWLLSVYSCFDFAEYKEMKSYKEGWIAGKVGITLAEEKETILQLEEKRWLVFENGKYQLTENFFFSTRGSFLAASKLKIYWFQRSMSALAAARKYPTRSRFGHAVLAPSEKARLKILEAYDEFFYKLKIIMSEDSGPPTSLSAVGFQILDLDEEKSILSPTKRALGNLPP